MASGVNFGTQQYFGFDPRTIPGCCLWLDAADARTLTTSGGGNVTQWADKSGLGATMTPLGSYSNATIQANYQNGLSALNFSGLNQYQTPANTGVYPSDVYILVALKTLTRMDVISIGPTNADNFNSLTFAEYTARRWHNGSSGFSRTPAAVATSDETSTSLLLMNWSLANNNFIIRRNGTQIMSTSAYTYGPSAGAIIQIGFRHQNFGTNLSFDAYVGEVVTFDRQLGVAERQQVEGYLAWKWALQANLPSSHPFRPTPPIMRGFLPADVLAPTFWLDAADATTFTLSGSAITQWRDKSSSQFTGTSVGSPVQGTLNGRPAVAFNGSQYFDFGDVADLGSANLNMFVVSQINTTGDASLIAKSLLGESQSRYSLLRIGGSLVILLQGDGATGQPTVADSSTAPRLLSWTWDRTTQTLYQNGTSILSSGFTSATTFNSAHKLLIGAYNDGAGGTPPYSPLNLNGTIGEILFLFGTLTTAQRQQVEGYLAWKWGLGTSLPTTHPYRSVLPSTPLFSPPQLSGVALWLDATDPTATGTLPTNGQSLTSWVDKSGNGYTVSQNASLAVPVFRTGLATNGLPGLDFTSGAGLLSATSFAKSLNVTVFLVGMVRSTIANWGTFWGHFPNGDHDNNAIQLRNTAGQTVINWHTNNNNSTSQLTYTLNSMVLYSCTMTSGNVMFMQQTNTAGTNSVTVTNGAVTINTASAPIWVGRSDIASEAINSYIYEIVYYQRVLTTLERQRVEGYLAWKWGLQASLPSTHPFAKVRP